MWPFRRRPNGSSQWKNNINELEKEISRLTAANRQLQDQLRARDVVAGEYLYHWRSVALPLLGPEWELRYVVLHGTTLKYYKSAKDLVFSAREEFSTLGCSVQLCGLVGKRYWAFEVTDAGGSTVIRLAALSEAVAHKWVGALVEVGCELAARGVDSEQDGGGTTITRSTSLSAPLGSQGSRFHHRSHSYTMSPGRDVLHGVHAHSIGGTRSSISYATMAGATEGSREQAGGTMSVEGHSNNQAGAGRNGSGAAVTDWPRPGMLQDTGVVGEAGPGGGSTSAPVSPHAVEDSGDTPTAASAAAAPGTPGPVRGRGGAGSSSPGPVPRTPAAAAASNAQARHAEPMRPSHPVHTGTRYSYLSSERMWHEKHTGLINLMFVIVVATNFRLALENALKYGWRYNPLRMTSRLTIGNPNIPLALCYPVMGLVAVLALLVELMGARMLVTEAAYEAGLLKKAEGDERNGAVRAKLRSRRAAHEWVLWCLAATNSCAAIGVPWAVIHATEAEPIAAGVLTMLAVVLWMKLVSYHHCCWDLRGARRAGEVRPGERGSAASPAEWAVSAYPENLTLGNLAYFLAAPTLTYQVNYPRTPTVRKKWLLRRVAELVVCLTLLSLIITQYIEPAVANSMKPLKQMNWLHLCERLLKLALPNTYCWMVMFYCLFHLWLNILAELLRFGDREFYKDWWNAATVGEYWKLWNMPVHKWLLRHVYFPATRAGMSRYWSMMLVFFVSALFHELVLGVPLHMVRLWAFSGIMLQVPLVLLTEHVRKRLNRDEAGNIVFWLTFCVVGQPFCVLMYTHDYYFATRAAA